MEVSESTLLFVAFMTKAKELRQKLGYYSFAYFMALTKIAIQPSSVKFGSLIPGRSSKQRPFSVT